MEKGTLIEVEVLVRVDDEAAARAACARKLATKGVPEAEIKAMTTTEMVRQCVDPGRLPDGLEVVDSSATAIV